MSGAAVHVAMSLIGPDYRFERQLGSGGNGVVLLAEHRPLNRMVAVKTIPTSATDGPARGRLRREGRTLATLGHPNILEIYAMIEDRLAIALVTEYVPGGDLDEALRCRAMSGSRLVESLCGVASALAAAHSVGIVHRDIKPANVLLDGSRAVVADFGLARLRGEFRTEDGLVTGTPLYMSPEQIDHPGDERPAMDVYSFAVMTYRALCGQPPFAASTLAALIHAHRHTQPPPPAAVRRDLPQSVSDVLIAALAKNPVDRAGLDDIVTALRAVDPDLWDSIMQPASTTKAPTAQPLSIDSAHATATDTAGSDTAGSDTTRFDTTKPDTDAPFHDAQPTPHTNSPATLAHVEPPIYALPAPSPHPRWQIRLLALAVGMVVGILLGLSLLALL